jgi:DNA-directed RNA polymerase II subunit RPB2
MDQGVRGEDAKTLSEHLLRLYFKTQDYPFTRHHIESYDQFLSQDLPAIVRAQNPILLWHKVIPDTKFYEYKAEIFIGGLDGSRLYIGSPTVSLQDSQEVRLLFPNEARLRNLTYAALVEADITVRITYSSPNPSGRGIITKEELLDPTVDKERYGYLAKFPLFKIPIMLHSRYCILYGKPQALVREAGECQYDSGGYFVVEGSEKVLITHQEQAFNTLYITPQERDPKVAVFSSITCLNPTTRRVKRVAFLLSKRENVLQVSLPFVRQPVPVFVVFRALGIQSDEEILRMIFPNPDATETKILEPMLHESIIEAFPFYDTFSAVQYMKSLTKGFSEAHVLDILYNQTFIHVENRPRARAAFLAECVRRILRVKAGIDTATDRDDIRNQRCLTSGVLTRMMFQGVYTNWFKAVRLALDKEYNYNAGIYADDKYANLFLNGVMGQMLKGGRLEGEHREASRARDLTAGIMRAFKGKWSSGSGAGVGEEKTGVIQSLSRLSYLDFMSHCRRVVLDFDTGMKLPGPRRLHTSQYGYFCTSETPGGASIGISKNLSMLTSISVSTDPGPFIKWLLTRGEVMACEDVTSELMSLCVPVFVNSGIVGYTLRPVALRDALKVLKWTGCLPASASVGFSIRDRRIFVYLDEGRPIRPLIHLGPKGAVPIEALQRAKSWRDLVLGVLPQTAKRSIHQGGFMDPLATEESPKLEDYIKALEANTGVVEYVDPYEMNETYVANFPEYIKPETSHMEIHPSTIVGLLTSMIPYANHNQSPRNQLGDSQSKQAISVYATNFMNRYDNQAHVLCYPQAPLVRTLYYDYMADGQMGYGTNLILAMGSFTGYNQDDGIVMNADSFARGMFRSTCYRSYEAFEEDDPMTHSKTRIGNPVRIPGWTSLRPGVDYSKLDDRGIIRVGEYVDETTALVGMYLQSPGGDMTDATKTAQVWTRGRVERVSTTVNNVGLVMVKVRVVQERIPELGDKFSNRHGQKGTVGMFVRGYDMPRTKEGIPVDMIMNPHAIPSRMTVAQLIEALIGKAAPRLGTVANGTLFMNDGSPVEAIGKVLRDELGMEPFGEELMYDGMGGQLIPTQMFIGNVYTMRLKHMPEDKWNARAEGRKEQRTHAPTGGRGAQGGLRIGEMERDAILGHGTADFLRESLMKRGDGYQTVVCNGCGTIPIYNEGEKLYICSMCDGPVRYIGDSANNLEILPPTKRSVASFSRIEIPYSLKLLEQELNGYLNMGMRLLTDKDVKIFRKPPVLEMTEDQERALLEAPLKDRVLPDTMVLEYIPPAEEQEVRPEDLAAMGATEDKEEAAPPAAPEVPVQQPVAAQQSGQEGVVLKLGNMNIGVAGMAGMGQAPPPAEEEEDDISFVRGDPTQQQQQQPQQQQPQPQQPQQQQPQQPQQQQQGVSVQTTSQPVLVVPLSMNQAPAPTEIIPPPAPRAPSTIAVDTSPNAMRGIGAAAAAAPRPNNKARRPNSPGGPPSLVNVSKVGASAAPATPSGNVQVNVSKLG